MEALNSGASVSEDDLILIGELACETTRSKQFHSVLRDLMLKLVGDPVLSLIELSEEDREAGLKLSTLFASAQYKNNVKDTAKLVHAFLNAKVKSTFHKLNIHAGMLASEDLILHCPLLSPLSHVPSPSAIRHCGVL